jgi:hypothetical protein
VDKENKLWSGMCFKCLGIQSVVTKATHSNIVIYNFVRKEQLVTLNVKGLVIL